MCYYTCSDVMCTSHSACMQASRLPLCICGMPENTHICLLIHQTVHPPPHHCLLKTCQKVPGNNGENNMVIYLHEILVKRPTVCTSSIMYVIAPICTLSIPSIHPSGDKHQEIPDEFPGTNYGKKTCPNYGKIT